MAQAAMTKAEPKAIRPKNAVLDTLGQSFKVFQDCQPLALGIHKTIKERLPELNAQDLRTAMRIHTASTRYLKVLSQADKRFDLDGAPAGEVTAEQRQQALDTLRERFKKKADVHKAELRAKQAAQQQAVLEKQRQERLLKLAEKFNTR
jgi:ProP effector